MACDTRLPGGTRTRCEYVSDLNTDLLEFRPGSLLRRAARLTLISNDGRTVDARFWPEEEGLAAAQVIHFPCHIARVVAGWEPSRHDASPEVSNGGEDAGEVLLNSARPIPLAASSHSPPSLARVSTGFRELGFDDDERAADGGARRWRRGDDGEVEGDRQMVPQGESVEQRGVRGQGEARRRGEGAVLPQRRPPTGDGGAALGDARGGVADPRAAPQVADLQVPKLPRDPAAGSKGGDDGAACSGISGGADRDRRRRGADGGTKAEEDEGGDSAATALATLPAALAATPFSLPAPVGVSPAGNRFWLLAGEGSEDGGETEDGSSSSGMNSKTTKYLASTTLICVDEVKRDRRKKGDRIVRSKLTKTKCPHPPRSHAPPARDTPASHASPPSPFPLFVVGTSRSPSAVSGRLCCANRWSTGGMDKLVQFGKKAWFVVRVMSGYEERRIRSYRLQLQQRLEQAQAKKEIEKQPEQGILSEVRQVVQQMQALNQHLEEAETAIDEYFKPIDKNAQILTDMQMEKEEKQMKEMLQVMRGQIQMQREIETRKAEANAVEPVDTQASATTAEIPPNQENTK